MTFVKLPLVGWCFKKIDREIGRNGYGLVINKLIGQARTKLIIEGKDEDLKKILRTKPVLLVAHHPANWDVIVTLAALEKRKDSHLLINASFINSLPELNKYLIPIYMHNRQIMEGSHGFLLKCLRKINGSEHFDKETEHQKNIQSINRASRLINQGRLVIMYPNGGGKHEKWFSGIGHLIKGLKNPDEVFLVQALVEGTTGWDELRLVPYLSKLMPKFRITFAQPIKLNRFETLNPKEITSVLEKNYYQWMKVTKESSNNFLERIVTNKRLGIVLRSILIWLMAKP